MLLERFVERLQFFVASEYLSGKLRLDLVDVGAGGRSDIGASNPGRRPGSTNKLDG